MDKDKPNLIGHIMSGLDEYRKYNPKPASYVIICDEAFLRDLYIEFSNRAELEARGIPSFNDFKSGNTRLAGVILVYCKTTYGGSMKWGIA